MTNILNSRTKRLIKEELLEWIKWLLGFLGFGIVIPMALHLIFSRIGIENVPEFAELTIFGTSLLSFGSFVVIMFIAGIIVGSELPQYVREGISRKEYFVSTIIGAMIVSLFIAPTILLANLILNLFVSSDSLFYNSLHIAGGELLTLLSQFLMYIAFFLLGYLMTMIWQRLGWLRAVVLLVLFLILSSVIGFNFLNLFGAEGLFTTGLANMISIPMIAILGIGTYALIKSVPVEVR